MVRFLILCSLLVIGSACQPTSSSTHDSKTDETDYIPLPPNQSISGYVGKAIWFEGRRSAMIRQHMMKGPGPVAEYEEQHCYIDYHGDHQTVVYYTKDIEVPKDDKMHKFYGIVDKIRGAGKGGNPHTEYFLNLHKVE